MLRASNTIAMCIESQSACQVAQWPTHISISLNWCGARQLVGQSSENVDMEEGLICEAVQGCA